MPTVSLHTAQTVPQNLHRLKEGLSVQGLLTIDLMSDDSEARCQWKNILPSQSSFKQAFPFWWDQPLQKLLPQAVIKLLTKQKHKLGSDWTIVSAAFPSLSEEEYTYYWFTVGTRTFYYSGSAAVNDEDPDECLALLPFADLFNHSSGGCNVTFSSEAYKFTTKQKVSAGEEIFTNYGEHNNDFLLAEYGFVLDDNKHDAVTLDPVLLDLFNDKHREVLESNSFWADYVLDTSRICYRTEVAIRLLCMPSDLWQKSLEEGFDEDDNYREAVDDILRESLRKYSLIAHRMIQEVSELQPRFSVQQAMLKRRWEQILFILDNARLALHNKTKSEESLLAE